MNAIKKPADEIPNDVELLLPWHAAGTLSRRDAARVEQALANDNELAARYERVREELGEAIRVNESLGAPSARAMEALFAKIDAEPARQPKASFNLGASLANFVVGFSPRTLGYGAAAAALAIVLQAGLLAGMVVKQGQTGQGQAGGYTTASMSESGQGAFVSVRFKPEATAADIGKFLSDNKAVIVDGPVAGTGMFKLRVAQRVLSEQELDTAVKTMTASPVIGFAAAVH
jgi:anti-sigma factor RsiW